MSSSLYKLCDLQELRARLSMVAKPDEHSVKGEGYRVKSLYFDNYNDKALMEKLDGVNNREKFRLRLYNNDRSFIRLEKKSKRDGICYKESVVISEEECRRLLDGDYIVLKEDGRDLCLELYAKMLYQQLRAKSIETICGKHIVIRRQCQVPLIMNSHR